MVDPISDIISRDAEANRRKREREASFSEIIRQGAVDQVKGVTLQAPPADQAAKTAKLARETGVPVRVAQVDPQGVEEGYKNHVLLKALDRAPSVIQFFTDPFRAAIADGDIEEMARMAEKLKTASPPPRKRSVAEQALTSSFLKAITSTPALAGIAAAIGVRETVRERARSGEMARDAAVNESTADRFGSLLERGAASAFGASERFVGTVASSGAIPRSSVGEFFKRRASQFERGAAAPIAGEQQFDQIDSAGDLGMFVLEQGVASLPEMSVYLTPGGWVQGAAIQTARIAQERAENDRRVEASGTDLLVSAPFGIASAALEKLGIEKIFVGAGKSVARRIAGAAAAEGATEFIQGDLEYIGSTAFTDKPFDMEEMAKNAIAGAVAGTGFGAGIRSGIEVVDALTGTAKANTKIASDLARGAMDAQTLDEIMRSAQAHKMRDRDPETFREFVAQQAENSGIENVFVPIEAIETYLQSENLPEVEQAFFDRYQDQIEEARVTGGDIVIPIADAATYLAGTPAWNTLRQDARSDPGGLSPRQIAEQAAEFEANVEKRGEEIVAAAEAATEADKPAVAVFNEVKQQLLDIGFTDDAASKQAAVFAANREAMGARFGVDAAEWHRQNPVEFRRQLDGGQTLGGRVLDQRGFTRRVTASSLVAQVDKSKTGQLRGVMDPATGEVFWWDAYEKTHNEAAKELGLDEWANGRDHRLYATRREDGAIEITVGNDFIAPSLRRLAERDPDGDTFRFGAFLGTFNSEDFLAQLDESTLAQAFLPVSEGGSASLAPERVAARFVRDRIANLLQHDDWAVLTAANPMGVETDAAENQRLNDALKVDLASMGLAFVEAVGKYGNVEPSFVVVGITREQALMLGRKYNQDSVLVREGLVYQDGSINPATGDIDVFSERPDDFFTEIASLDVQFAIGIDFDTRISPESEITIRTLASGISPIPEGTREAIYRNVAETKNIRVAADGTLLLAARDDWDLRDGPQERAAQYGAKFVDAGSPEWEAATPTQLDAPPVDADGKITLQHFSSVGDLTVTDPTRWGTAGRFLPPSERQKVGKDPDRTYFGIATGQPGGYVNEFGEGAVRYEARIDANALYPVQADAEGLWAKGRERAIIEAGYQGYWSKDPALGLVAVVFTPQEVQRVAPDKVTLYQSDNPIFYSALAEAIRESKQNRAPAKQWKATLAKTPGVKEEEMQWSGLLDMLDFAPDATMSKEQLLGIVEEGGIRVEEVLLGGAGLMSFDEFEDQERETVEEYLRDQAWDTVDEALGDVPQYEVVREVIGQNPDLFEPGQTPVYGEGYQLADQATGERLPEVYATEDEADDAHSELDDQLREDRKQQANDWVDAYVENNIDDELRMRYDEAASEGYLPGSNDGDKAKFRDYSTARNNSDAEYRELLLTLPDFEQKRPPNTHWDQPAVVAHLRFRDAVDVDGQRVMFIEEIQSDWHQKGRREGYKNKVDPAERDRANAAYLAADEAQTNAQRAWERAFLQALSELPPEEQNIEWSTANIVRSQQSIIVAMANSGTVSREAASAVATAYVELVTARQARSDARTAQLIASGETDGITDAPFKSTWPNLVMKRAIRWAVDEGFDKIAWIRGEQQNGGAVAADQGVVEFYDKILPKTVQKLLKPYAVKVEGLSIPEFRVFDRDGANRVEASRQFMTRFGIVTNSISDSFEQTIENSRVAQQGIIDAYSPTAADPNNFMANRFVANARAALELLAGDLTEARAAYDRYVAEDTARRAKEEGATNLGFVVNDNLRAQATRGFPLFQRTGKPRGQVELSSTGSIITLFEDADLSTLLHETGHVFFEEFRRNASKRNAPADVKADWAALKKWLADQGQPVNRGQITREGHELIARGFEVYFMGGRAPSAELEGAFRTFRAWLLRIYKQIVALASPITPEVRGVFDRMLATEQAIAEFSQQQNTKAAFTEKPEGMTDAEFAAYTAAVLAARERAQAELTAKVMAPIRQRETARYRDQKRKAREKATAEINSEPRFVALHLLRTGRWLNNPERDPQPIKLNTGQTIDTYGEDALTRLPAGPKLTSGDGADIDLVAELAGFVSGDAMMKALFAIGAEQAQMRADGDKRQLRQRLIDDAVEQALERSGAVDPMKTGEIEEEALAAVENAAQGEVLGIELRHLARVSKNPHTPYRLAREWAARKVRGGRVQDVASRSAIQRYARAAAKAGRLAEEAILSGDMNEAFRQKQAQLINHALVAEAKAAADEIEVIVRRMNRLASRAAMKSVDQAYFERVHELLEDYDFRPRSQRVLNEKEAFNEWAAGQIAAGFEVLVPPRLQFAQNYLRVQVDELYGLNDAVQSLMRLGKLKQTLIDAGEQRDFNALIDEIVATIANAPDRKLEPLANTDDRRVASVLASLVKIETLADDLDGGNPNGPMNRLLVQRATQAENRRAKLREDVLFKITDAYLNMPAKMRRRLEQKVTIEEFPHRGGELDPRNGMPTTMTRMELLSVALNTGNAGNLEKMARGEGWSEDRIMRVLNRELTKEDWDFVQSMWDAVDTLWPDIVATERAMSGVAPEKVEPLPVDTPFGRYRGGYWPVVYDFDRSQRAENNMMDEVNDLFGAASGINTPKGHTITRTGAVGPIRRSVEDVLFRHIEKVITRISYAEYARDVLRVIEHPRVRNAIDVKLGREYRKQIQPWLKRTINASVVDHRGMQWWEKFSRSMRVNVTLVSMGFRVSTGIAQSLGLFSSAGRIGPRYVASGIYSTLRGPFAAAAFVDARSEEMQRRGQELNRDVAEAFRQMRGKTGALTTARAMAFWHIGWMDRYVVSIPTWIGAHQKGIADGMTDAQASAYADKIVRTTQGSGREKDLANWQSPNSETTKWLTMFYSYFNVMLNSQWESGRALKRKDWRKAAMLTFWFMVATPLADALLSGDIPDQEDDEDTWANWFARNVFFNLFSGVPLVRDVAAFGERSLIGEYASLSTNPLIRIEEAGMRGLKTGYAAWEGDAGDRWVQTAIETPGYFLGLPTGQPAATAEFMWDYSNGEVDPEGFYDWYYGLAKGRLPEEE